MAEPTSLTASERAFEIIATILSRVPEGLMLKGPFDKTLYNLLKDEEHPLITGNFIRLGSYSYSPTIDDIGTNLAFSGGISHWGSSFGQLEVKRTRYFRRVSEGADFTSEERKYLGDLGDRLVRDFSRY